MKEYNTEGVRALAFAVGKKNNKVWAQPLVDIRSDAPAICASFVLDYGSSEPRKKNVEHGLSSFGLRETS